MSDEIVRQLVLGEAAWNAVVAFLRSRGLDVGQIPPANLSDDDLPTYVVTVSDELMERARRAETAP